MLDIFNDPLWRAPLFQVTDEVINRHGPGSNPDGDIKLFLEFNSDHSFFSLEKGVVPHLTT